MFTSEQNQTQNSLLLSLIGLHILRLDFPKFITVSQNEIHVFIKSFEGSNKHSPVLKLTAHPVVDVLQHLGTLTSRLSL